MCVGGWGEWVWKFDLVPNKFLLSRVVREGCMQVTVANDFEHNMMQKIQGRCFCTDILSSL